MKLLEAHSLGKNRSGIQVFDGLSFSVNSGEKIGLIGKNGCGKTTLLDIITRWDNDYSGTLKFHGPRRSGYVPQYFRGNLSDSVSEFLLGEITSLRRALSELETAMGRAKGDKLEAILQQYQKLRDEYDSRAGDSAESRMERLLERAGLVEKNNTPLEKLSGGERNILALLQAMISSPDLLVLDEPGNHLDYAGMVWLETFLAQQKCAVILVSHNRYLLDRVAETVWEMSSAGLAVSSGNYSSCRLHKLTNTGSAGQQYRAEHKKIKRLEELVRRFEERAANTADPAWGRRLRARRTQLEKTKEAASDTPVIDAGAADLSFSGEASRADIAVKVTGYSKRFGSLELFEDASLYIATGERVALTGPNGCGKTTFLNDLVTRGGWDNPVIKIGPSMVIGYCAQHQEVFDAEDTILEEFEKLGPGSVDDIYRFVSRFNFLRRDIFRRVHTLSGGEKNRLQLARAIYLKANFLILDEPTNHLDIDTREAIEEGLEDFQGTLLVVSHDRYFLDKIAQRVVEVTDRRFADYRGNFTEYWSLRSSLNNQRETRLEDRARKLQGKTCQSGDGGRWRDLEARIMRLEGEQKEMEHEISMCYKNGEYQKGGQLSKRLQKMVSMIDKCYSQWNDL